MRGRWLGWLVLAAGLAAGRAEAQARALAAFSVELRGSAAFPTGDFGEEGRADTGYGFGGTLRAAVLPALALYAGYDRLSFEVEAQRGSSAEAGVDEDGFSLGAELRPPAGLLPGLFPWVRAGALWNRARLDFEGASPDLETDRTLGFEVGVGVDVPLGMVVRIVPSLRYRAYSTETNLFGTNPGPRMDVSYLTADFWLSFGL